MIIRKPLRSIPITLDAPVARLVTEGAGNAVVEAHGAPYPRLNFSYLGVEEKDGMEWARLEAQVPRQGELINALFAARGSQTDDVADTMVQSIGRE